MIIRRLVPGLLLILAGCGSLPTASEQADIRISVEGASFVRDPAEGAASVAYAVQNLGSTAVFVPRCGDRLSATLERWEGGRWVQYSGGICLAIYLSDLQELMAEDTYRGIRGVHEPGQYRIRVDFAADRGEPSRWTAVSDAFVVE